MTLALKPPAWTDDAACTETDPDIFFPTANQSPRDTQAARAICAACPVLAQCLRYAISDPSLVGIWGGTTLPERQRMRRGAEQCHRGHLIAEVGRDSCGACRECRRLMSRTRRRKRSTCQVEGCPSIAKARGCCRRHDPLKGQVAA